MGLIRNSDSGGTSTGDSGSSSGSGASSSGSATASGLAAQFLSGAAYGAIMAADAQGIMGDFLQELTGVEIEGDVQTWDDLFTSMDNVHYVYHCDEFMDGLGQDARLRDMWMSKGVFDGPDMRYGADRTKAVGSTQSGVEMSPDGQFVYRFASNAAFYYQHRLGRKFDLFHCPTSAEHSAATPWSGTQYTRNQYWSEDGLVGLWSVNGIAIWKSVCTSAFDLSTATWTEVLTAWPDANAIKQFAFNSDGTEVYYNTAAATANFRKAELSTAYDFATIAQASAADILPSDPGLSIPNLNTFRFWDNGKKLVVCAAYNSIVYELGTAYDISTLKLIESTNNWRFTTSASAVLTPSADGKWMFRNNGNYGEAFKLPKRYSPASNWNGGRLLGTREAKDMWLQDDGNTTHVNNSHNYTHCFLSQDGKYLFATNQNQNNYLDVFTMQKPFDLMTARYSKKNAGWTSSSNRRWNHMSRRSNLLMQYDYSSDYFYHYPLKMDGNIYHTSSAYSDAGYASDFSTMGGEFSNDGRYLIAAGRISGQVRLYVTTCNNPFVLTGSTTATYTMSAPPTTGLTYGVYLSDDGHLLYLSIGQGTWYVGLMATAYDFANIVWFDSNHVAQPVRQSNYNSAEISYTWDGRHSSAAYYEGGHYFFSIYSSRYRIRRS